MLAPSWRMAADCATNTHCSHRFSLMFIGICFQTNVIRPVIFWASSFDIGESSLSAISVAGADTHFQTPSCWVPIMASL